MRTCRGKPDPRLCEGHAHTSTSRNDLLAQSLSEPFKQGGPMFIATCAQCTAHGVHGTAQVGKATLHRGWRLGVDDLADEDA